MYEEDFAELLGCLLHQRKGIRGKKTYKLRVHEVDDAFLEIWVSGAEKAKFKILVEPVD